MSSINLHSGIKYTAAFITAVVFLFLLSGCAEEKVTSSDEECKKGRPNTVYGTDVGNTYKFGSYEQDNDSSDGKEDIEWTVLAKEDGKALLISRYALDCKEYNTARASVTWENCTLRKWLNDEFLNTAFSQDEQSRILTTDVTADKNPEYDTPPGKDTQDKVFLLSITEAYKYLNTDELIMCAPTAYAKKQGVYTNSDFKTADGEAACEWFLRSPGDRSDVAAHVDDNGMIYEFGAAVISRNKGVRPAVWINL